jgi:hypothetical protein
LKFVHHVHDRGYYAVEHSAICHGSQDRSKNIVDQIGHAGIARRQEGLSKFDENAGASTENSGAKSGQAYWSGRKISAKKPTKWDKSGDIDECIFPESV